MLKKIYKLIIVVLSAALLLCGCADNPAVPTGSAIIRPTLAPLLPLHSGGTLYTLLPKSEAQFDPLHPASKEMSSLYALVFESLVRVEDGGALGASLAEKWELKQVEDGENAQKWLWTLSMRANVKWHDGTAFRAQDVVYTIGQIKSDTNENPYKDSLSKIKSYSAIDEKTLEIIVDEPFYGFLDGLTFPIVKENAYAAVPAATPAATPAAGGTTPTVYKEMLNRSGTGPYVLGVFTAGNELKLDLNQSWWKRAPVIAAIHALVPRDDAGNELSAVDAFSKGDIDVLQTSEIGTSKLSNYPGIFTAECAGDYYDFLALNVNRSLFSDVTIRQALSLAIDKKDITSSVYMGQANSVDIPFAPDSRLYDRSMIANEYSIEEADKLLAAAGWTLNEDGNRVNSAGERMAFTLLVNDHSDFPQRKEVAARIVRQLDKVGILVNMEIKTWAKYKEALQKGEYDAALAGYRMSPLADLTYMLGSQSQTNITGYKSETLDAKLSAVLAAQDEELLLEACKSLQRTFLEELPHIPLYFRTGLMLYNQRIQRDPISLRDNDGLRGIEYWTLVD